MLSTSVFQQATRTSNIFFLLLPFLEGYMTQMGSVKTEQDRCVCVCVCVCWGRGGGGLIHLPGVRKELRALALLGVIFRGILNAGVVERLWSEPSRESNVGRPTKGLTAPALLRWSPSGAASPVEVPLLPPVDGSWKGFSKHKAKSARDRNNNVYSIEWKVIPYLGCRTSISLGQLLYNLFSAEIEKGLYSTVTTACACASRSLRTTS